MLKVIGLGNVLRGDDGIGPVVLDRLKKMNINESVTFFDIGSDAISVLEHLMQKDPVLLIDCAKMGKKPGEVLRFSVDDSNLKLVDKSISLHGFGFAEVYRLAKEMGKVAPCTVIGIEPLKIEFNSGLSEEVKNSIPIIKKMVFEEAKIYA